MQTEYAMCMAYSKQAILPLYFWRFPESDPLEDCELFTSTVFQYFVSTFHCCPDDNIAPDTGKVKPHLRLHGFFSITTGNFRSL